MTKANATERPRVAIRRQDLPVVWGLAALVAACAGADHAFGGQQDYSQARSAPQIGFAHRAMESLEGKAAEASRYAVSTFLGTPAYASPEEGAPETWNLGADARSLATLPLNELRQYIGTAESTTRQHSLKDGSTEASASEYSASANGSQKAYPKYAREVRNLVNDARREANVRREQKGLSKLPMLKLDPALQRAAQKHSVDQARLMEMSHSGPPRGPAGSTFDQRIAREGYQFATAGENVAYGANTPKEVMAMWMKSIHHRQNILNPSFTELGVGMDTGKNGYKYWTQDFASPA